MNSGLYQGNRLSKTLGVVSFMVLVFAIVQLLNFRWAAAAFTFIVSLPFAYFSYRLAGGKHNPIIAKSPVQSDQQTRAGLETMEEMYGDNYVGMIDRVYRGFARTSRGEVMLLPEALADAFRASRERPCAETWQLLKKALLENPLSN